LTNVLVIYDSLTGNTERMANAVAEGVKSVNGVNLVKHKIGEKFSMKELADASGIIIGSPTNYSSVTPAIRHFLESMDELRKSKQMDFQGKIGAGFGSYGWSGEALERITGALKILGFEVTSHTLRVVENPGSGDLDKCRQLGKDVAELAAKKPRSK
jgi:flavorubredoxin